MSPKVIMVTNHFYPSIGGLEKQALRLANELVSRGVRVEILTPRYDQMEEKEVVGSISVIRFPMLVNPHCKGHYRSKIFYFLSLSYALWLRRNFFDVIHVHQALFAAAFSVIAAKLLRKKIIIKVSGSGQAGNMFFLNDQLLEGRVMIWIMRFADAMISLSRETTEELLASGFRVKRIFEVPNGVPVQEYIVKKYKDGAGARDSFVAIYVGRVSQEEKRVDILIKAWAGLVAARNDVILKIVGDGPDLPMISKLVKELKLERHVELLGFRDDVNELLIQSDCFILPSISEGMSNALLEAMCCGICCLASRNGGNEDLIEHGVTGLLFDLNVQDLLNTLNSVLTDRKTREMLGSNAQLKIREKYSFEVITPQYIKLYESLTAVVS